MTEAEKQILKAVTDGRLASALEHKDLKDIVMAQAVKIDNLTDDLRGNKDRNIEGIGPMVWRHDKTLQPITFVRKNAKAIAALIVILDFILDTTGKGLFTAIYTIFFK